MVKSEGSKEFERMPLVVTGDPNAFEGMLFDVDKSIQYYVDSDGIRSATYSMTRHEPAGGRPSRPRIRLSAVHRLAAAAKSPNGGDVAAIRGTEVRVRRDLDDGRDGGTAADRVRRRHLSWRPSRAVSSTAAFTLKQNGFYHVELDGPNGEHVTASPKYTVDVLDDQPPTVTFEKPKRDISANPLEEVFLQARADDDFGVKQLDLVYSVNGGPDKTVTLYGNGAKALKDVSAGHTVYLEELGVKPGDFVAYYARLRTTTG